MNKIPLYIPDPLSDAELAYWFAPLPSGKLFTDRLPVNFFETEVERVADAAHARAIVLPNNFKTLNPVREAYIKAWADAGAQHGIPVFVFCLGDLTDDVRFDSRIYVLRLSVYRSAMVPRDIVIPTVVPDPFPEELVVREKRGKPVVSFCGMAGFPNARGWVRYYVKTALWRLLSIVRPAAEARIIGVYWRRAMMHACNASKDITTNFIVRRTFSGSSKTIELDPAEARRQFVDSIVEADFVLAPKGDGNYSNRFLEALSYGRIPVLLDTDAVLPLEKLLPYERFVVRVPMARIKETPRYIHEFYGAMDEAAYGAAQKEARQAFVEYLRSDTFFRYLFTDGLATLP